MKGHVAILTRHDAEKLVQDLVNRRNLKMEVVEVDTSKP